MQRARSVYWKKWAAKHEYEELKEGAWLDPGLALLRKNVMENWTEKHRNVARKIFLEGGWTQKRLFDIDWSWEQKARTSQKEWRWQRGIVSHPLSDSQWNRSHFSMRKWKSEKHKTAVYQQRASRVMLPLTAPCWVPLACGEHAVGQWCSWIMMKNWGRCMGCTARWRQNMRSSAPSRGRS